MRIVPYNPGMQIASLGNPQVRVPGHRYLEVAEPADRDVPLLAIAWHAKRPAKLKTGHALIEFPARKVKAP